MRFVFSEYERLLGELLSHRRPLTYANLGLGRQGGAFVLRHDIDYGLDRVGEMPLIEKRMGISATYFIEVSSLLYNPFTKSQRRYVDELVSYGHRIGLHTDSSAQVAPSQIDEFIEWEMDLLTKIAPVDAVSFHMPPRYIVNNDVKIKYINTYDHDDMQGYEYMSDSCGKWSKGDPIEYLRTHQEMSFQILAHPFLWGMDDSGYVHSALSTVEGRCREMLEYLSAHNSEIREAVLPQTGRD